MQAQYIQGIEINDTIIDCLNKSERLYYNWWNLLGLGYQLSYLLKSL